MPRKARLSRSDLKQAALQAAYLSIYSDRRLIGIPDVRPRLVHEAMTQAMGYRYAMKPACEHLLWGDNRDAARDAQEMAVEAARAAMSVRTEV